MPPPDYFRRGPTNAPCNVFQSKSNSKVILNLTGLEDRTNPAAGDPLMGSADIQSLADLGNAYGMVKAMRPVAFSRDTVVQLLVAVALPVLPLVFTMIPLEQLVDRLLGVVL